MNTRKKMKDQVDQMIIEANIALKYEKKIWILEEEIKQLKQELENERRKDRKRK